jgi:hypothetical protein
MFWCPNIYHVVCFLLTFFRLTGINGEDVQSTNLLLAQFEKVARAKSKWKCTLKEGVMTLNSKDVLFGKASGEFFWG